MSILSQTAQQEKNKKEQNSLELKILQRDSLQLMTLKSKR